MKIKGRPKTIKFIKCQLKKFEVDNFFLLKTIERLLSDHVFLMITKARAQNDRFL